MFYSKRFSGILFSCINTFSRPSSPKLLHRFLRAVLWTLLAQRRGGKRRNCVGYRETSYRIWARIYGKRLWAEGIKHCRKLTLQCSGGLGYQKHKQKVARSSWKFWKTTRIRKVAAGYLRELQRHLREIPARLAAPWVIILTLWAFRSSDKHNAEDLSTRYRNILNTIQPMKCPQRQYYSTETTQGFQVHQASGAMFWWGMIHWGILRIYNSICIAKYPTERLVASNTGGLQYSYIAQIAQPSRNKIPAVTTDPSRRLSDFEQGPQRPSDQEGLASSSCKMRQKWSCRGVEIGSCRPEKGRMLRMNVAQRVMSLYTPVHPGPSKPPCCTWMFSLLQKSSPVPCLRWDRHRIQAISQSHTNCCKTMSCSRRIQCWGVDIPCRHRRRVVLWPRKVQCNKNRFALLRRSPS